MKTLNTILVGALLLTAQLGFAQIDETVKKSFEPKGAAELSVDNSFGDITIKKHDKSYIDVLVEINVVPSKSRDNDKVQDKVYIDIKEQGSRLELKTINDLNGINTDELDIDYTINIPKNTSLEIRNQFGDTWIEGTSGKVYARIQHGDFFCGDIGGSESSLKVQFGDLRLEKVKDAEIEVQHGELDGGDLTNVELDLMFSDAEILSVSGWMEIDVQHSDLSISHVRGETERLDIDGQFSDLTLGSDKWALFAIELEGSFTDFSMPSSVKSLINYESKEMHSREYRINESAGGKRISIDANHSDVDLD
jgi:hypothetical protein